MPVRRLLGCVVAMAALWTATAFSENLLRNPDFEQTEGSQPLAWDVYVMPQEGAYGRLDEEHAQSGRWSAMLHIPEPYPKEPANNWSQNIVLPGMGGKELIVGGYIKTKEATTAELWAQCWQTQPLRMVAAATTAATSPVTGTTDWTWVETRFSTPDTTEFVTVRCVLKGRGAAWFDGLSVEFGSDTEKNMGDDDSEALEELEESQDEEIVPDEDGNDMSESLMLLRETNEQLLDQVIGLQQEVEQLHRELELLREPPILKSPLELKTLTPPPGVSVPPLVPEGFDWETLEP